MSVSSTAPISATLRTVDAISTVRRERWSALAGAARSEGTGGQPYNPFISFEFLSSLEDAGCVSPRTGWQPTHLLLESEDEKLLGAVPAYLKGHSQGEYVFDHGWADAFERAGGDYYPKLLSAVPFTPATGPRLLHAASGPGKLLRPILASGVASVADQLGLSSAHVNFVEDEDEEALVEAGFLLRNDRQFHWSNDGYSAYDDFLATLASRKRKALKRERREALADNGVEIEWLTGTDLTEAAWDAFYRFYVDTGSRKWGRPYLNREFFSLVGERMADDILLVMAKREGRWIAGALNFIGSHTLYGRHWGCVEHHPSLHFEVCYHQAIDFAISRKLQTVEAGAQGEHKLARGYAPVLTKSCHHIPNRSFRKAVARYLAEERREMQFYAEALGEHTPFRKGERTDRSQPRDEPEGVESAYAIERREVEEQE